MLKPIRWNTFLRDFFIIQLGFLLYGFAIALIVRADLGTGTWLVLEVALANILGIKIGTMTVYMGFIILILALALRERVGWGTLGNILSIGPWLNLFLDFISTPKDNLALQMGMFLLGVLIQIGWLLGGPAGIGTVAFALLIGPSVQWAFKLFHVHPHQPEVAEAAAD
jgi:hypothetical protein